MRIQTRTESYLCQEPNVTFRRKTIEPMVTDPKRLFSDRLNKALDDAGFSPKGEGRQLAVAKAFGVSQKGARKWLEAEAIPHTKRLAKIAEKLGTTVEWLLTGRGTPGIVAVGDTRGEYHTNDFAFVPLFDVRAAAGSGKLVTSEHIVDTLAFRADFLRHELNAGKDDLYLIHVEGDSMEPTLRAGDVILVDHRRSLPDREGIYVIRMDDALLVKRIQLQPGGRIVAASDNDNYKPFELKLEDGLAVIGRVVWAGRRF